MPKLTESYIRGVIREILSEALILEISAEEKTKVMSKSNERMPFNRELMKQAIEQGREVGLLFQTNNDKTRMPVAKYRIIHPVVMGTGAKDNKLLIRGLHVTGQSEKAARASGSRSAEAEAEKDGISAWRLFRVENIRSMFFTDRFFSDNIPGYNPSDSIITSREAVYNPATAKAYQDNLVVQSKEKELADSPEITPQQPEPMQQQKAQTQINKDIEQMGYEDQPIQEKKKNVRNFFK